MVKSFRLPVGLCAGLRHPEVLLRPLDELELASLLELDPAPATRAAFLVEKALDHDPIEPKRLVVGDRDAVLLELRRRHRGDALALRCSCPACSEALDLELTIDDLLVPPQEAPQPFEVFRAPDGTTHNVRRLEIADLDAVAGLELQAAANELRRRAAPQAPAPSLALEAFLAELDPQAEIELALTCPSCAAAFISPLDVMLWVVEELEGEARHLFAEVDRLARAYHWSEHEILALPAPRRRRYLDLINGDAAP
jgi:hypothetical protein